MTDTLRSKIVEIIRETGPIYGSADEAADRILSLVQEGALKHRAMFNANDHVRVRLTAVGKQALRKQYVSLGLHLHFPYREPEEDADGWSTWQLHELAHNLGPQMLNGGSVPFETWFELLPCEFDAPAPPLSKD